MALELLWFLRGDSNVRWLQERGVTIWDEWAGRGRRARSRSTACSGASWPTPGGRYIDQIAKVWAIRNEPRLRRHVVTAWNPAEVDEMALPPCHTLFQFYVEPERAASCQLYQRTADMFLGVPFNIASYALLTVMVAQQTGLEPGEFVWTGGDCHVYDNHVDAGPRAALPASPTRYPRLGSPDGPRPSSTTSSRTSRS